MVLIEQRSARECEKPPPARRLAADIEEAVGSEQRRLGRAELCEELQDFK